MNLLRTRTLYQPTCDAGGVANLAPLDQICTIRPSSESASDTLLDLAAFFTSIATT